MGDIYAGLQRIGRIERRGNRYLAFRLDGDDTMRPIGSFANAKDARAAVMKGDRDAA